MAPGDKVVAVTPLWLNITEILRILRANVERGPLAIREHASQAMARIHGGKDSTCYIL